MTNKKTYFSLSKTCSVTLPWNSQQKNFFRCEGEYKYQHKKNKLTKRARKFEFVHTIPSLPSSVMKLKYPYKILIKARFKTWAIFRDIPKHGHRLSQIKPYKQIRQMAKNAWMLVARLLMPKEARLSAMMCR